MKCPQCGTRFNPMTTDFIFPMGSPPKRKTNTLIERKIKSPCCQTIIFFQEDERVTNIFKKMLYEPFEKLSKKLRGSETYKHDITNQIIELGYSTTDAQKAVQCLDSPKPFLKIITD